jgi:hypothetical protein
VTLITVMAIGWKNKPLRDLDLRRDIEDNILDLD